MKQEALSRKEEALSRKELKASKVKAATPADGSSEADKTEIPATANRMIAVVSRRRAGTMAIKAKRALKAMAVVPEAITAGAVAEGIRIDE